MKDEEGPRSEPARYFSGALMLAAFFVVWSLRATVFYFIDESIVSDFWRSIYSTSVKFALWVVPAVAFAREVRKQSAVRYLGITGQISLRDWGVAFGIAAAYLIAVIAVEAGLAGKSFIPVVPTVFALVMLVSSCFIEELLFRGVILHEFSERFPALAANLITSLLFVAVHWPHWLWKRGLDGAVLADSIGVFLVSLVIGAIYLRTRSIWPCFLTHVANNIIAGLLV